VNKLVSRLDEVASGSRRVELTQLFNFATFDIMAHLCFGQSLGLLENNKLNPWVHSVFESLKMLPFVSIITYYPLLNSIFTRYEPKWVTEQRKLHCQFSADQVNQRLQKGSEGPDIWNLIVLAQDSENALSLEEMHSNAEVFMLAGSETTGRCCSFTESNMADILSDFTQRFDLLFTHQPQSIQSSQQRNTYKIPILQ
jgi:cytochrome P450